MISSKSFLRWFSRVRLHLHSLKIGEDASFPNLFIRSFIPLFMFLLVGRMTENLKLVGLLEFTILKF